MLSAMVRFGSSYRCDATRPVRRGQLSRRRDEYFLLSARAAGLIDKLLPPGCVICGVGVSPGPPICTVCNSRLSPVPSPHCRRCGAPATSVPGSGTRDSCDWCDAWPTGLTAAASAVLHRPPADELVAGLKYRGWTALAPALASLMVEPVRRLAGDRPAILVPVPLDPVRQRKRGFNQATLLATELSRAMGLQLLEVLSRRTAARRQAESGRAQRFENVLDAFTFEAGNRSPEGSLILVDDVLTTGATAAACATVIREAGHDCLGVVTFARALFRPDEARP